MSLLSTIKNIFRMGKHVGVISNNYSLGEVFKTNGTPEHTFVERHLIKNVLDETSQLKNKAILFLGYSKSGKTVYRKKYFDENGYRSVIYRCSNTSTIDNFYRQLAYDLSIPRKETLSDENKNEFQEEVNAKIGNDKIGEAAFKQGRISGIKKSATHLYDSVEIDVNYICNNLSDKNKTVIILEDYHLVDERFNKKFSEDLKHFIDEAILFVIIGIPGSPSRCFKYNPDLTGRSERINFDYLSHEEIEEIIHKGEKCLNFKFPKYVINKIIEHSLRNAFLVQSICYEILSIKGINKIQPETYTNFEDDIVDKACASLAMKKLDAEYHSIINIILAGTRRKKEGKAFNQYEEIVNSIRNTPIETLEAGLNHTDIAKNTWDSFSPQYIEKFIENKTYQSEVSFKNSVQTQITYALNQLADNFKKANAREIIIVQDKNLYLMDIIFKFYLNWNESLS